ncbi:MAG TPA: hypothetical protein DEV98_04125 [Clostridiales bacterium]|nr:hypothetical protein [Clostridiales bacterium]
MFSWFSFSRMPGFPDGGTGALLPAQCPLLPCALGRQTMGTVHERPMPFLLPTEKATRPFSPAELQNHFGRYALEHEVYGSHLDMKRRRCASAIGRDDIRQGENRRLHTKKGHRPIGIRKKHRSCGDRDAENTI